jgi:hypothetical protein
MVKITMDISTGHCWVIKSRDSGRNMYLNDQPRCGRLVSATHDLNRQNFNKLIQELNENQLRDLCEDPKKDERVNQLRLSGKRNDTST